MTSHYEIARKLEALGYLVKADEETAEESSRSEVWKDEGADGPFAEVIGDSEATLEPLGTTEPAVVDALRKRIGL